MDFEVIAGTYEHFLVGYSVEEKTLKDGHTELFVNQTFTNQSHSGSITALTTVGKYLVSGSTDEVIRLINMESRSEHGSLQQQDGTITHLSSYDKSFVFSGSEDGTVCIWKTGSWLCEKTLRGHKAGVIQVSIHPSGKLALSTSKDRSLKTWNLIKGRIGFVTNMKGLPEAVQWSPDGTHYAVSVGGRVDVYSVETAKVASSFDFGKRVVRLLFASEDVLIAVGDKEEVDVFHLKASQELVSFPAHKNRIKDVVYVPEHQVLITASNDGLIKLWKFNDEFTCADLIKQIDTSCRITCLAVYRKTE